MSGYKKHLCIELCFDHISISIAMVCPQDPQCVTSTSFSFQCCSWKKKYLKLPQLITSCVSQDFPKVEPTHHHFPSLSSHGY